MDNKNHYLTYAVFFVKGKSYGEVPYCSVDYGEFEGEATIRKLCFCGSEIIYDESELSWLCSASGETIYSASPKSLLVGRAYSEPLIPMTSITIDPDLYWGELSHPERDSVIVLNEEGEIHVFIKVPPKKVWMITDPLPVSDWFAVRSIGSDLIVEWSLEIGDDLPGSIDVTIPLSLFDVAHKDYVKILASGKEAYLHFLEKDSLSVIAHKRIIPNGSCPFVVRGACELAAHLSDKPNEREDALRDFSEARMWSKVAILRKAGLPDCTEFLNFTLRGIGDNFPAHISGCKLCQEFFPSSNNS